MSLISDLRGETGGQARLSMKNAEEETWFQKWGGKVEEEKKWGKRRVGGQKSPNENGPLRQKLMTGDQKSKISIQHFELFRVAGHLFALQMPLLSIPPQLSLPLSFLFPLSLEQENGPASGLGDRHVLSSAERESFAHAKQEIICHFQHGPGSTVTMARKQIKQRSENMYCKPLKLSARALEIL